MNPGDKVLVTKSMPSDLPKEGIFEQWRQENNGTPYCVVAFESTNPKLGKYTMLFDPWDLTIVEEPVSFTCDTKVTRGRRFKQDHTCTLPKDHTNDEHYCGVCRFSWNDKPIDDSFAAHCEGYC